MPHVSLVHVLIAIFQYTKMNNLIYYPNNVVKVTKHDISAHDDKWKMKSYNFLLPGTPNFGTTGHCII